MHGGAVKKSYIFGFNDLGICVPLPLACGQGLLVFSVFQHFA